MRYFYLSIVVFLLSTSFSYASETNGTIEDSNKYAHVCHDESCTTYGVINFKPTINANTPGANAITITDSGITGHAWGNEVGWINFTPTGYGVTINPTTGALGGTAYAVTGGWLNFNPSTVSGGTSVGVTINSSGEFSGWAWLSGAYGGWIRFDCSNAGTCVKTDWRPTSARSGGGSGGSTGGGSSSSGGGSTGSSTETIIIPETDEDGGTVSVPVFQPDSNEPTSGYVPEADDFPYPSESSLGEEYERAIEYGKIEGFTELYRVFSFRDFFGITLDSFSYTRPDCFACLVVRMNLTIPDDRGIIKFNGIPESWEVRLSTESYTLLGEEIFSVDIEAISLGSGIIGFIVFARLFLLFGLAIIKKTI